jgi:hypothetical protein
MYSQATSPSSVSSVFPPLPQIPPITGNHLLVPPERFLARAGEGAVAAVVAVDVNQAVALAHFAGRCRYQVNAAPGGVAHHRHAVGDGVGHGADVFPQVADAVIVSYLAVGVELVVCAQAVFHQEQRFLVAVVHHVHGDAQTQRVDAPAPVAAWDMRVGQGFHHVGGAAVVVVHIGRRAARGVIAEGDKIDGVLQDLGVAFLHHDTHAFLAEYPGRIRRVGTAGLHVDKEQVLAVFLQRGPHVFRFAGPGVEIAAGQHAAHLVGGVHLMGDAGCQRTGHQFVVYGLVFYLLGVLTRLKHQSCAGERAVQHNVDLVEGEPILHQPVEGFEAGAGIAGEKLNHFAAAPGAIFGHQVHRHVEMAQRHQRFDAVFAALFEQAAVEGDAFRVGRQLVAVWVNPAPGDGGAEHAKAHLRHQRDVIAVAVVKINRVVAGVKLVFAQGKALLQAKLYRHAVGAMRDHVNRGQPFATLAIAPFRLVGGQGTAP